MPLTSASPTECAKSAASAARRLATSSVDSRDRAIAAIHDALTAVREQMLEANERDLDEASEAARSGELSQSLLKRLDLGRAGKYDDMLQGILDVKQLQDPIGRITLRTLLDDGLELQRVTVPIGTLLIIFEARPEVIANISALAIKSGNAALLKGGKESSHTFKAISDCISAALVTTDIPEAAIQLIARSSVPELLSLDQYIDLVIPRGSNELVRYVKSNTKIPVMGHADGLCSIYIHPDADPSIAERVLLDSKTGYTAACNAVETVLIHQDLGQEQLRSMFMPLIAARVSFRCDSSSFEALESAPGIIIQHAEPEDYDTEFLEMTVAVKSVHDAEAAIAHINEHSSHHTDVILTEDAQVAEHFMDAVDSAGVYWNASSRFADGHRYGFGTEVGISTNKIHARGPVGLEGLTTYKYKIRGRGQVPVDYGPGLKQYKHLALPIGISTRSDND